MSKWDDYGWDYYSESRPRRVAGGIKAKSERGAIGETWWSKRWVSVLESLGMGARLTRGRSYARQGQVLSIDIESGHVKAQVQGSLYVPYKIDIRLQPLTKREWDMVAEAMAAQAIFAAKLLAGEMPGNIEEAFRTVHLSLFPTVEQDLKTRCSCPDWANPCKHIAAVYYILAEHFDEDPFLIFKLRGCTKEELIAMLREKRAVAVESGAESENMRAESDAETETLRLEDHLATFWQAGADLETFTLHPDKPDVDQALLKRLGNAPFAIGSQSLSTLLAKAYESVDASVLQRDLT
jgi:uncharacterized Zn finger protein